MTLDKPNPLILHLVQNTSHSLRLTALTLLPLSQFHAAIVTVMPRLINGTLRRQNSVPVECYACNQFGPPVFHSISCHDPAHQPQWEALAGSSLIPIKYRSDHPNHRSGGSFPGVLDPRSATVRWWNRVILLSRAVALAVDPLFFFALSVIDGGERRPCVYVEGGVAVALAVVRTCVDAVHLTHVWLQFRLAYVSRETLVVGCGKLVWDPRVIASHYLRCVGGFWFDAFVLLPFPQVFYLLVVPKLMKEDRIELMMTIIQLIFLLQFLPKVYHSYRLMRQMQKVTGYIFGSIWWGFGLNFIAYFLASHSSGGYWYALSIGRITLCLRQHCTSTLSCASQARYESSLGGPAANAMHKGSLCLDEGGTFPYGIYDFALPLISSHSISIKILYCNLWGLMALSTMGNNLEPTCQVPEVIFTICMVLGGLSLFTLLIGNIQVFLHAVMARRRKMQLRYRDMEWWMKRRQLPSHLRRRVRVFEHQRWAAMGGPDEMEFIKDLPEGLRRDIKRFLCLDLIKKAPLFQVLDDVVLDNICDRVKPLIYSKGEKVIREGDPVQKMVFIVRGRVKRSQRLSKGMVGTSVLESGSFFGDELLSWCLRLPFLDRYPASTATFTCIKATEAFGLDADHLRYIADHFRYRFANEKIKRTARYYSSNWRMWAAVNIQLAWRRYVIRMNRVRENGHGERRLRHYAAMFMALRPHDHLE